VEQAVYRALRFENATEVAMACATFGLVLGGLIGGPVARYLVKHSSSPDGRPDDQLAPTALKSRTWAQITSLVLIETIAMIAICLTWAKWLRNCWRVRV
jgi:ESS family glutamate:Na+ symporter